MTEDRPININNETWSVLLILIGCAMTIISKHYGLSNDLGSAIIGAGTMAFTNSVKTNDTIATGDNPVVVNNPELAKEKKVDNG